MKNVFLLSVQLLLVRPLIFFYVSPYDLALIEGQLEERGREHVLADGEMLPRHGSHLLLAGRKVGIPMINHQSYLLLVIDYQK